MPEVASSTSSLDGMGAKGLCGYINEHFMSKESFGDVKKILAKATEEQRVLEAKVKDLQKAAPEQIRECICLCEKLLKKLDDLEDKVRGLEKAIDDHVQKAQPLTSGVNSLSNEVKRLENFRQYLCWIYEAYQLKELAYIHIESSTLKSFVPYRKLAYMRQGLDSSSCSILKEFVQGCEHSVGQNIKVKLAHDFKEILKEIKWPFGREAKPSDCESLVGTLINLFQQLILLQFPTKRYNVVDKDPLMAMELLVEPIVTRFKFHFSGARKTNRKDKPEWFFTHMLSYIRDHETFIQETVQSAVNRVGLVGYDCKAEFMKILVDTVNEKIKLDIGAVINEPELFAHLVTETIKFESDLRDLYEFPSSLKGSLEIFTENLDLFEEWIALEKKMTTSKFDDLLQSDSAWTRRYAEIEDVDEMKAPKIAENVVTLFDSVTGRYKLAPLPYHKLRFFIDIQLTILNDFHYELVLAVTQEFYHISKVSMASQFCLLLNAVNYVCYYLAECNDEIFFIEMKVFYDKFELEGLVGENGHLVIPGAEAFTPEIDGDDLLKAERGIFDVTKEKFDELRVKMVEVLSSSVENIFSSALSVYKGRKWISSQMPESSELQMTAEFFEPVSLLKQYLTTIEANLACGLFDDVWQAIAFKVDEYVYTNLILTNKFSSAGVTQFFFDMKSLFIAFSGLSSRPENYLKRIKEANILLSSSPETRRKLLSLLMEPLIEEHELQNALGEVGVHRLPAEECQAVLKLHVHKLQ
eukprot:Nk52_evm48s343 gene=Nk52_evmTU48s343